MHVNHIDSAKLGRWNVDLSANEVAMIENEVEVKEWCNNNEYKLSLFLGNN